MVARSQPAVTAVPSTAKRLAILPPVGEPFRFRSLWPHITDGNPKRNRIKTIAIARGQDKEPLAKQLGAFHYIDSQLQDPAAELAKLGGAKVILATVTNAEAMQSALGGLSVNGTMMLIGAVPSLQIPPFQLLSNRQSVKGWYSGTSLDSQDALAFSVLTGVRSMNEVFPLEQVNEAYDRMITGKARFRVVLTTGN